MINSAKVNWQEFLGTHDMKFEEMPKSWEEAPYFGNGNVGAMLYQTGATEIRLQIFRSDVHDHRDNTHGWTAYSRPRFMLGWFVLNTKGRITGCDMKLDLWNAELAGRIETELGSITIQLLVHSLDMAILCTAEPSGGNEECTWIFEPGEAATTRPGYPDTEAEREDFAARYGAYYLETLRQYEPNPPVRLQEDGGVHSAVQDLKFGGQYSVAWHDKNSLVCGITNTYPESTAADEANDLVRRIVNTPIGEWVEAHREWWHTYYPISFVTLPDKRLENIYWHQMYKLACATRADRPMMDTSGPWIQPTPWPYITWDLNVQLCYWPVCASGRLELGESLINTLHSNSQTLVENVRPVEWQEDSAYIAVVSAQDLAEPRDGDMRYYDAIGDLTWALHNCWQMYRHTMDDGMLRDKLFPLLRRSINLYFHICEERDDGKIHLQPTYSPEYGNGPAPANPDCNFDLALFRWGCQTLLEICRRLSIDDPLVPRWRDILNRLTDYPADETGLNIAEGVPLAYSHRHYSHLLMIYPLYLLNIEQQASRELIKRSLEHWIGFEGALQGYSYTGSSSISAAMGDGDKALEYLEGLYPFLLPNGMYKEAGPVMETPLSAAQCIHDMLIQSWGGMVRVFPAVPGSWREASFSRFRAEGGFEVSATREDGETREVTVKSLAGEPLVIKPGLGAKISVESSSGTTGYDSADGVFELALAKGDFCTITRLSSSYE